MKNYRSVAGELKILERKGEFIFPVEIWMLNNSVNRNKWKFVNLEKHRPMWAGVPILVAYVRDKVGDGHNQETKMGKDGEPYQSFTGATAERIVGAISENPSDIRLEERDGYTWVVGKGLLWKWYAKELVDKISDDARQGRAMSVSIEALVTDCYQEADYEVETEYTPLGVTILGDSVQPAVEDAHIAMLNAMQDEFKELKLRAASYIEPSSENEPQKNTKKGMKNNMRLSNQQLRELQPMFDGMKLLAAEQRENGCVDVCLMGKENITYMCRLEKDERGTDMSARPERLKRMSVKAHWCAEGCEEIEADASDMVECAVSAAAETESKLTACQSALEKAQSELATMRANENARRLEAAKAAAKETLDKFNANRDDKVSEKVLSALNADIDAGKFTACEDENHKWNGDKTVTEKVLSACASAVMEMDAKLAAARAEKNRSTFAWEKFASGFADDGSVEALLARKGIQG